MFCSEFIIKMQIYLVPFLIGIEQFRSVVFMRTKLFSVMTYAILTSSLVSSFGCFVDFSLTKSNEAHLKCGKLVKILFENSEYILDRIQTKISEKNYVEQQIT